MKTAEQISTALDITAPFLMIDNYELIEKGKTAIATKSISVDDWFFECHLPKSGVMPGTLQILLALPRYQDCRMRLWIRI